MKQTTIGNLGFFCTLSLEMRKEGFREVLTRSLIEPVQYVFELNNRMGRIFIDSTSIDKDRLKDFLKGMQDGLLCGVISAMPVSVSGDWNEKVEVVSDGFKFKFEITKYERDINHNYMVLSDPTQLPGGGEKIRRFVQVTVTVA